MREVSAPAFRERERALSRAHFIATYRQIIGSEYLEGNQLGPRFAGSSGFSVIFRRSAADRVRRGFPGFSAYLDQALVPSCNACYLNALVLEPGASVGAHADTSLSGHCGTRVHPDWVSVLYLSVPDDPRSGLLVLRERRQRIATIAPLPNTLLWFRGDLVHAVTRVRGQSSRVSLVCEQYALDPAQLDAVPALVIDSRATMKPQSSVHSLSDLPTDPLADPAT